MTPAWERELRLPAAPANCSLCCLGADPGTQSLARARCIARARRPSHSMHRFGDSLSGGGRSRQIAAPVTAAHTRRSVV